MMSLRLVLTVGVLVQVASAGCAYRNAQHARESQTLEARGWSCRAAPVVKCGDKAECSGWDDEWRATCPLTGEIYRCFFDRANADHPTCRVVSVTTPTMAKTVPSETSPTKRQVKALPPLPVDAVSDEGYRESRWGMSPAQLQQAFPTATEYSGGLAILTEPVAGKAASTGFRFTEDRLTQAIILFSETHVNTNNYLLDYRELKELLSKKYGRPTRDVTHWSKDLYRDDPKDWGTAVSAGHLTLAAEWETDKTSIQLLCDGERFKIKLRVFYLSKELKAFRQATDEKKNLEGL